MEAAAICVALGGARQGQEQNIENNPMQSKESRTPGTPISAFCRHRPAAIINSS
jgi:hypothetical protein